MKAAVSAKQSLSKTAFDDLLGLNESWLKWIEDAVEFQSLLGNKIPWEQLDKAGKTFINERLASVAPNRQILLNSFYMTMVSGFEEYLRTTIQEITRQIFNGKPKYEDLTELIRNMHIRESARLLKRLDSPPDYLTFSVVDLCRGLGSCVPGSETVVLNPEVFSNVESLIKLENFVERVSAISKPLTLEILAKHDSLKLALKLKPNTAVREVSKALSQELAQMARYRNRIAHTGGSAADITTEIVAEHRSLLQALASAIDASIR